LVPMAVPCVWIKRSRLNSNTLWVRVKLINCRMLSFMGCWTSVSDASTAAIPSVCGMLVYRDETSMVARMVPGVVVLAK